MLTLYKGEHRSLKIDSNMKFAYIIHICTCVCMHVANSIQIDMNIKLCFFVYSLLNVVGGQKTSIFEFDL